MVSHAWGIGFSLGVSYLFIAQFDDNHADIYEMHDNLLQ